MEFTGFDPFDQVIFAEILRDTSENGPAGIITSISGYLADPQNTSIEVCENVIASVEVLACLIGNTPENFPSELNELLQSANQKLTTDSIHPEFLSSAADAIDRIGADSELREIWAESLHSDQWFEYLQDLQNRILDDHIN